ncbi:hypothetical protein N0V94_004512 [Neodidymelliopsis sp. IMI 364377]|nr:hypothetical protein N0V94_004512 [Neodidymelliopsis sp. IMI 364377]
MAKMIPDERLIYLVFRNIFKGIDARIRNVSTIKKKIRKHGKANSVKLLLENGVFDSTLRAKIRFSEMFDVSPAQSAERAASEAEAAQVEAETIRNIVVVQHDESVVSTCVNEEAINAKGKGKQPVVEEVGRNKDLLETRFLEKRRELAARRAELDRIERAAWETMHEEDWQYQLFAASNLEEMIDLPETALHSRAPSEIDEDSEEYTEEYTEEDVSIGSEGEPDFYCMGESS